MKLGLTFVTLYKMQIQVSYFLTSFSIFFDSVWPKTDGQQNSALHLPSSLDKQPKKSIEFAREIGLEEMYGVVQSRGNFFRISEHESFVAFSYSTKGLPVFHFKQLFPDPLQALNPLTKRLWLLLRYQLLFTNLFALCTLHFLNILFTHFKFTLFTVQYITLHYIHSFTSQSNCVECYVCFCEVWICVSLFSIWNSSSVWVL